MKYYIVYTMLLANGTTQILRHNRLFIPECQHGQHYRRPWTIRIISSNCECAI